uniref:Uncharacterized protein n=1 Tax=Ditylenchus dipsaci TaxID=166011 RepID=A0A915E8S6_9BILA
APIAPPAALALLVPASSTPLNLPAVLRSEDLQKVVKDLHLRFTLPLPMRLCRHCFRSLHVFFAAANVGIFWSPPESKVPMFFLHILLGSFVALQLVCCVKKKKPKVVAPPPKPKNRYESRVCFKDRNVNVKVDDSFLTSGYVPVEKAFTGEVRSRIKEGQETDTAAFASTHCSASRHKARELATANSYCARYELSGSKYWSFASSA